MINMYRSIKRVALYVITVATLVGSQTPLLAHASDDFDKQFYSSNDILFYDPRANACAAGSGGGALDPKEPTSLKGKDNYEKVWNYLTGRGLSPVVAAGVMGNLEKESAGMNPWGLEGASYHGGQGFGIVQWTGGRRPPVEAALREAGITVYNDANREKGLLVQLNYLWKEVESKYGGWEQFTAETSVGEMSYLEGFRTSAPQRQFFQADEMKGKGSLLLFHAVFVRSGDQVVPQPGHGNIITRLQYGLDFFEKFGSGTGGTCSSVSEGGLTFDQAKRLMDWYLDGGWESVPPKSVGTPLSTASAPGMGQCFAWSNFVASVILGGSASGPPYGSSADGIAEVKIRGVGDGVTSWAQVTKESIQPFTIIAYQGHTGIIVGKQDGKLIYTDLNVTLVNTSTDKEYIRNNIPGSTSNGRVKIIENIDDIKLPYTNLGYAPLASPKDMGDALRRMQTFMSEKSI